MDIEVSVSPIIKEWIVATYGSDVIKCEQDDFLSNKIKYLLDTTPENYKPAHIPYENRITIILSSFGIGSATKQTIKRINKNYRFYLSDKKQGVVERVFNREFKACFHCFVLGYVASTNNHIGSQEEGIESFCNVFGLTLNKINYEMLKKSWDRSTYKQKIINKN